MLNARLRRAWLRNARIGVIGDAADLTYGYEHLGAGPQALSNLGAFADALTAAERPMIIVGASALARADGAQILRAAAKLGARDGWNGFNVLHSAAARVGGLDLGFLPGQGGRDARAMLQGGARHFAASRRR